MQPNAPVAAQLAGINQQQLAGHEVQNSPIVYDQTLFYYLSLLTGTKGLAQEIKVRVVVTRDGLIRCEALDSHQLLWVAYLGKPNGYKASALRFRMAIAGAPFTTRNNPYLLNFCPNLLIPYLGFFYMFKGVSRRRQFTKVLSSLSAVHPTV